MSDPDAIKVLLAILMTMVGGFYASFVYEMRQLRSNIHVMRSTLTHHEFRLINLERKAGVPDYDYKEGHV